MKRLLDDTAKSRLRYAYLAELELMLKNAIKRGDLVAKAFIEDEIKARQKYINETKRH